MADAVYEDVLENRHQIHQGRPEDDNNNGDDRGADHDDHDHKSEPPQHQDSSQPQSQQEQSQQQPSEQEPQPSLLDLDVCLFGPSRKCPKINASVSSTKIRRTSADPSHPGGGDDDDDDGNGPPTLGSFLAAKGEKSSGVVGGGARDTMTDASVLGDDDNDGGDDTTINTNYDSLFGDHSRWKAEASRHDIDLAQLRKIASRGIPDEGSHRGVVWRVLLEYLPLQNIAESWKEALPPHRALYHDLVDGCLEPESVDNRNGSDLRGQLGKTLRDRQLRHNYNQLNRRLDDSMDHMGDWSSHHHSNGLDASRTMNLNGSISSSHHSGGGAGGGNDDDDEQSVLSEQAHAIPSHSSSPHHHRNNNKNDNNNSNHSQRNPDSVAPQGTDDDDTSHTSVHEPAPVFAKIHDRLASPLHREEWKRSGITIDRFSFTSGTQSSSSSSSSLPSSINTYNDHLNLLKIPKELTVGQPSQANEGSERGDDDDNDGEDDTDLIKGITASNGTGTGDDETMDQTDAIFTRFLQDARLLQEIRKDVVRTHPDLRFYLEPVDNLGIRRYAALERILFVWAKLNRGVRYVQGMNEIVGTIYYVLANDHNSDWANEAEADTYYLFHTLMIDMKDVFVADLDSSITGIQGRISNMQALLQRHDPEILAHLEEVGVDASFFAIRWLTTLLSREFLLPDTIRLWDSMFASTHRENFLRYVCVTMVMTVRDRLLMGDFSTCLRLLQSYPPTNVEDILESSRALWIYESQVNLVCRKGGISLHHALQMVTPPSHIVMAFGLKGGMAPKLTDQMNEVAAAVQDHVEQARTGLLGRAKKLWTGWGGSLAASLNAEEVVVVPTEGRADDNDDNDDDDHHHDPDNNVMDDQHEHDDEPDAIDLFLEAAGAGPPEPLPTKPRAWNRGRTESYGSVKAADNVVDGHPPTGRGTSSDPTGGMINLGKTVVTIPQHPLPPIPVMGRFWNRRGSFGSTPQQSSLISNSSANNQQPMDDRDTNLRTLSTAAPTRKKIWDRS